MDAPTQVLPVPRQLSLGPVSPGPPSLDPVTLKPTLLPHYQLAVIEKPDVWYWVGRQIIGHDW